MSKSIKSWAKKLNIKTEILENLVTDAEHEKEIEKQTEKRRKTNEKRMEEKYRVIEECAKD